MPRPVRTSHLKSQIHGIPLEIVRERSSYEEHDVNPEESNGDCGTTRIIIPENDAYKIACILIRISMPSDSDFVNYDLHITHVGPDLAICIMYTMNAIGANIIVACVVLSRNRDRIYVPRIIDRIYQHLILRSCR